MKKTSTDLLQEASAGFSRGDLVHAEENLRALLSIEPNRAQAWFLLGVVYEQRGRLDDAIAFYRRSLAIQPRFVEALGNLADALRRHGRAPDALTIFDSALEIAPDNAELHYRKGLCLQKLRRPDDALASFGRAIGLDPDFTRAQRRVAELLADLGMWREAVIAYQKLVDSRPDDVLRIRLATLLPIITLSDEEITEARTRFETAIDRLCDRALSIKDPIEEGLKANFYLVYHGRDDRRLQEKLAALYERACPSLAYVAPHCRGQGEPGKGRKISIGIISQYFYNHTIGAVFQGIVAKLSRENFIVTVFGFPNRRDDGIRQFIKKHADRWIDLPNHLPTARELIAEQRLDVLFYTDIGMDPFTYFLAFSRLAPVQCTTWGHPVTTGIRNIDYYISCKAFEPEDSQRCYSERLVLLDAPPTYYYKPVFPAPAPRSAYGLPEDKNLYLCPQTLYKFHPDFDGILAAILREDPNGLLVLVTSKHDHWTELLMSRFRRAIPDVVDRIRVIRYSGLGPYLNLLAVVDVMLDTLHYGGGNTSLQALSIGTPIVTLPGQFQRGRHTYGYYAKMQYLECVAQDRDDYVRIAARLGTDKAYRARVSAGILAANHVLFEDEALVRQLEHKIMDMVHGSVS